MTEREKELEHKLASAWRQIESMKPFLCKSLKCKKRELK